MSNPSRMHRLLLAVLGVCGLAATAAGCAKMHRPDDDARAPSRQAAEPESARNSTKRAPARDRADEAPPPEEQGPSEAATEGIGTGAGARERYMKALSAEGRGVDSSDLGYFMDVHEASLRQATSDTELSVGRDGNRLQLTVPTSAFADGSDELKSSMHPALGALASVLAEFDKTLVTVVARAGERKLSVARASAVARHLQSHGVAARRLVAIGGVSDGAASIELIVEPVID